MSTTGPGTPSTDEEDTPAEAPTEVRPGPIVDAPATTTEAEAIAEAAEALSAAAAEADAVEVIAEAEATDPRDDASLADRTGERLSAAKAEAGERLAAAKADASDTADAVKEAAKKHGGRARVKLGKVAADAREATVNAAAGARERAAGTDVKEFAANTTSLIDTARPFFLAGCAAIFAILGFIEGDPGTAQVFAVGAVLCVAGAAFSGELNAMLHSRSTRMAATASRRAGDDDDPGHQG